MRRPRGLSCDRWSQLGIAVAVSGGGGGRDSRQSADKGGEEKHVCGLEEQKRCDGREASLAGGRYLASLSP